MRRIFLFLAALTLSLTLSAQEHTKFLGISMEEPLIRFGVYLEGCNIHSIGSSEVAGAKVHQFQGTMYERDSTNIAFMMNPDDESIFAIVVTMPYTADKETVQQCYMEVFNSLCDQYNGSPQTSLSLDETRQPDFAFENAVGTFSHGNVKLVVERKEADGQRLYAVQILFQDLLNAKTNS